MYTVEVQFPQRFSLPHESDKSVWKKEKERKFLSKINRNLWRQLHTLWVCTSTSPVHSVKIISVDFCGKLCFFRARGTKKCHMDQNVLPLPCVDRYILLCLRIVDPSCSGSGTNYIFRILQEGIFGSEALENVQSMTIMSVYIISLIMVSLMM
jgi:hypothetical protein